ncbi:MAG: hypothetical protein M3Q10_08915 [Chloroflexota bacterium]|nr:hypothetical protein [Chloroflexota bacterium]
MSPRSAPAWPNDRAVDEAQQITPAQDIVREERDRFLVRWSPPVPGRVTARLAKGAIGAFVGLNGPRPSGTPVS